MSRSTPSLSSADPPPPSHPERAPRAGLLAALWIPTDEEGRLMRRALARHLEWLKARGLHGILALGSTGEFARMTLDQRETVLAAIVELAAPLPVVANISSLRLDEVISLGQTARSLGAVGVALMPPGFFPLAQDDILEFFLRAAEHIDLPFYLYNYPEVTGNRIGPEILAEFADRARLVGIKQSGAELDYHDTLIALGREKNFPVFTAADPLLARYLDKGAAGCLGGLANFQPETMGEVYAACRAGRSDSAAEASARLARTGELLSPLLLPMNARAGMEARGLETGALKTVVSASTQKTYAGVVESLRQTFAEWGLAAPR